MLKKFLAALICITVVLGGVGLVSAATSTEAIINYVDMHENRNFVTDENGEDVFVDCTEVVFELKNECGTEMKFAPFVAFYSGARFVDAVRAEALEIATDDTAEFSVTSEVAFAKNADSCKVFVLDDNIVPYADVAEGELNAYDKNYAYFIRAVAGSDGWKDTIKVQLLDKTGEVYTAYLADKVTLENASEAVLTAAGLEADGDANLAEFADYDNFAELLANQVVTYAANSAGEIKAITFPQNDGDEESLYYGNKCGENVTYDKSSNRIQYAGGTPLDVKEDAVIFFINNYSNNVYYNGEVSGFANAEASAVATREYLSDSIEYDYGMFFNTQEGVAEIIVLYNTSIEREEDIEGEGTVTASDNYAYFIRAAAGTDGWNDTVKVQLLDKSGEVYTAYLADKVTLENASEAVLTAAGLEADGDANLAEFADYDNFAELLANQLVTYAANNAGEISAITFATTLGDEDTFSLYVAGNATFDEGKREAAIDGKKVTVTDDTIVFFIKGSNTISAIGDTENFADVAYSEVATGADINNISGYAAAYDVDGDGGAKVLVILNATSGITAS
ncbi:MAG: hypothetical protein IJA16_04065 [Clostridia bacterium]|nr:hypothetical protein [Clostridia bacterium]